MELKANELRLNNLVTLNHKVREELFHNQIHAQNEYFEVLTIYSDGDILLKLDDENVELDIKEIEPIPLTEEWLLKFGFEKIKSDYEEAESYDFYNENLYFNMANQSIKINGIYAISFIPEHVHQLQNLYYALTNEELKLK